MAAEYARGLERMYDDVVRASELCSQQACFKVEPAGRTEGTLPSSKSDRATAGACTVAGARFILNFFCSSQSRLDNRPVLSWSHALRRT